MLLKQSLKICCRLIFTEASYIRRRQSEKICINYMKYLLDGNYTLCLFYSQLSELKFVGSFAERCNDL